MTSEEFEIKQLGKIFEKEENHTYNNISDCDWHTVENVILFYHQQKRLSINLGAWSIITSFMHRKLLSLTTYLAFNLERSCECDFICNLYK